MLFHEAYFLVFPIHLLMTRLVCPYPYLRLLPTFYTWYSTKIVKFSPNLSSFHFVSVSKLSKNVNSQRYVITKIPAIIKCGFLKNILVIFCQLYIHNSVCHEILESWKVSASFLELDSVRGNQHAGSELAVEIRTLQDRRNV